MKKNIILTSILGVALAMNLTSCSDPDDALESVTYGRVFSPINLEAKGVAEEHASLSWNPSAGAETYTLEIFADDSLTFEGTPAQTITGLTVADIPYQVTGLIYDTKYSARVMAHDAEDSSRDSKWTGVYFRTSAQQIFESLATQDVSDKTVTLTWPAEDTDVTEIVISNAAGEVVVTYTITDEDRVAGQATVPGLTPETDYTAVLYYNGKQRGNRTFKTIADLEGATVVRTDDDFTTMLAEATEGQVFALYSGTYTITSEDGPDYAGCAAINKTITIKGIYPTDKPTIQGRFQLEDGAGLTLSNVILDGGKNATTDQAFNYKTADVTYAPLLVQECEIKNFVKGFYYLSVAATVESITVDNNIIHDVVCDGGDMFDCRKGYIKTLTISNNTIYNCAKVRDFVRYDDVASSFGNPVPVIVVSHNTIDNVISNSNSRRFLYVRFGGKANGQDITWSDNLITNTQGVYTNQSTTSDPKYSNNYYFGCTNANLFAASDPAAKAYWNGDTTGKNGADPQYADAANGDFTLGNEDVSKLEVGDPRWY